jgi:hypothetical protein
MPIINNTSIQAEVEQYIRAYEVYYWVISIPKPNYYLDVHGHKEGYRSNPKYAIAEICHAKAKALETK